jgi:hypothetical protein
MGRDAVFCCGGLGAARYRVADGGQTHAVPQIGQAQVLQRAADTDSSGTDDADTEWFCHRTFLSPHRISRTERTDFNAR